MENIVDLETAKNLKKQGYSKPCEYYYQDRELIYSKIGLKKTKNGEKMNHNKYDDFIYSAPTNMESIEWLLYEKIK